MSGSEVNISSAEFIKQLGIHQDNVELSILLNRKRLSKKEKQRLSMLKLKGISPLEDILGKSNLSLLRGKMNGTVY